MRKRLPAQRPWLDTMGCVLSAACAVHCLATPFVMATLPLLASELLESALATALALFATTIISAGAISHGDYSSLAPLSVGLALIGGSRLGELGGDLETAASVLASAFLAWAHLRNRRVCRHATCVEQTAAERSRQCSS